MKRKGLQEFDSYETLILCIQIFLCVRCRSWTLENSYVRKLDGINLFYFLKNIKQNESGVFFITRCQEEVPQKFEQAINYSCGTPHRQPALFSDQDGMFYITRGKPQKD